LLTTQESAPVAPMFHSGALSINPNRPSISRIVRVGGMSKGELLAQLQARGIELNEAARILLAHDSFTTSKTTSLVETVEVSAADLGFAQGTAMAQIHERAIELGLSLCPLELGPYLRLQFLDQPEGCEGAPPPQHRAPPGSITVASTQLTDDDAIPKGFYLRRINGVLWLRGYWSGPDHIWSPEDRLVFRRSQVPASGPS
jgi:hypothetical protein